MGQRKLKNYIIFPKFQITLVIINLIIMTFCFVLVFYQVHDSFAEIVTLGKRLRLPETSAYYKVMDYHLEKINLRLIIAAVICYACSFVLTIAVSHKVSGPLYRLKKYFLDMKMDGYSGDLSFREGDYYGDLPEIINSGIKEVRK